MKFSIRDLFLVTAIVALAVGWWVDRRQLLAERQEAKKVMAENDTLKRLLFSSPGSRPPPSSSAPAPNSTQAMKYSLRSLMVVAAIAPPLLAGVVWLARGTTPGVVLLIVVCLVVCLPPYAAFAYLLIKSRSP
jgi:Flp pilus assembly protein TadB